MLFWIAPVLRLAPYVLASLGYLRALLFPPVTPTTPAAAPFTPPFQGGQCVGVSYDVLLTYTLKSNPNEKISNYPYTLTGAVGGTGIQNGIAGIFHNNGASFVGLVQAEYYTVEVSSLIRRDNLNDNCGNIPNPNPSLPIADNGIATNTAPNLDSALIVIEAVPPVILPSFAAALAAALAAARNALDALEAIKAIARAIEALSDLLNRKNAEENKKQKEKKENQDTVRYEFGSIQRDGFLRLYPDSNLVGYVAQQLDISFITIPPYLGKYFGNFSPNYYRHKPASNLISSLGYISFVSPTFGIMSTHHLEFRRSSIKVPENSIGFYYHLGLDGALTANAFAFYTKPKP